MKRLMLSGLLLLALPCSSALAGDALLTFRARLYVGKTGEVLPALCPEGRVSVRTLYAAADLPALEKSLEKARLLLDTSETTILDRPAALKSFRSHPYVRDYDIEWENGRVEIEPIRATCQWGLLVTCHPLRKDDQGRFVCRLDAKASPLTESRSVRIYKKPLELPRVFSLAFAAAPALPAGASVIAGATMPGTPSRMVLLLLTLSCPDEAPDAAPASALSFTRWILDPAPRQARSLARLPALPAIEPEKAAELRRKADTLGLVFAPWSPAEGLRDAAQMQSLYVQSLDEEELGGKRYYDPIVGNVVQGFVTSAEKREEKDARDVPFRLDLSALARPQAPRTLHPLGLRVLDPALRTARIQGALDPRSDTEDLRLHFVEDTDRRAWCVLLTSTARP